MDSDRELRDALAWAIDAIGRLVAESPVVELTPDGQSQLAKARALLDGAQSTRRVAE